MKIQVRKNILSHKWEVQKQEHPPKWLKVAEFDNKDAAVRYALAAQNSDGDKLPKPRKKNLAERK